MNNTKIQELREALAEAEAISYILSMCGSGTEHTDRRVEELRTALEALEDAEQQ
jgi:hypothetical protein